MAKLPRPFEHWSTYEGHGGIDYGQPRGTKVPALGAGVVTFSGYYSARGGYAVFVDYGLGFIVGDYHHDSAEGLPKVGTRVKLGDSLGPVGMLGMYSTGPHLHQEVWVNGRIIAPPDYWKYIDKTRFVGDGQPAGGRPATEEEDDMALAVFTKPKDAATVYEIRNGRKRGITGAEWEVTKAAYKAAGEPLPYANGTLTAAQLAKIPNA